MAEAIFEEGTDFRTLIQNEESQQGLKESLKLVQEVCHGLAAQAGWWDDTDEQKQAADLLIKHHEEPGHLSPQVVDLLRGIAEKPRDMNTQLLLIHSEISEAMEGVRKNLMDDKLPHRKMVEVELADAIVRILDMAGGHGLDVAGALVEKVIFNISRADHQPENRAKADGKKF